MRRFYAFIIALSWYMLVFPQSIPAQLVSNPQAIPRTGNLPVVFLNGQETDCSVATFQHSFGIADQVLQANGRASVFFNNCSYPGSPSIEKLGDAFGTLLAGLTYADGQPVGMVDVVGYSMGGLIVRSYLTGKQETNGVFSPPPTILIHKAIFIATPNFGAPLAAIGFGISRQLDELSSGSHFLMDLNTWNQNHDDLRGIDAMAIIGSGGTGYTTPGFDDGLVPLSSGSLRFYMPGRTRILPRCHQPPGRLLGQTGLCPPDVPGISFVNSSSDDNIRIIVSFLAGTPDWQSIGTAAEQNSFLQTGGGLQVRARTSADGGVQPDSITATPQSGPSKQLNMSNSEIAYTDLIAAGNVALKVSAGSASFTQTVNVPPGGSQPFVLKPGPVVNRVAPAAAALFPLVLAPRMIVSIYGTGLAQAAAQAPSLPLPIALSDVTVTLNGAPLGLFYASPLQINAVLPDNVSGLLPLKVQNSAGSQMLNVWLEPAFPAVFTLDQSGSGPAAALNATNNQVVSSSNPLHGGEQLELFLTGLGTTSQGGLPVAKQSPTVTVGGADCPVTYAGAAPGFSGLDQINCRVPSGLGTQAAAPVVVKSGVRSSQTTTIAVQ